MAGRSSAGRSGTSRGRGRGNERNLIGRVGSNSIGRGGSKSIGRGGNNSMIRSGTDVSRDETSNGEHMDQFDGLENLNGMNSPEIGSPASASEAQHSNAPDIYVPDPNKVWLSITPERSRFVKGNGRADNGEVIRSITTFVKQYYREVWPTWTSIPIEDRDRIFDRFKSMYCWAPNINEFIRPIFDTFAARRLSDSFSMDRAIAMEKAAAAGNPVTEDDISSIIPYNPSWIKQDLWSKLVIEHWNTVSWLKMSKANKNNRGKFVAGYHCTGSAGYISFREKLEEKKGPQSSLSFLIESHTKKEKRDRAAAEGHTQWLASSEDLIDDRAREVVDRLKASMVEKYGADFDTHPKHDSELWERATGERKKGRSYCSGTSSDPSFVATGTISVSSSYSYAQTSLQEVERVKQTMEEMREAHEKAKREMEEHEAKLVEAHENAKKEMAEREDRLKKEVEDSKALSEAIRREMREQMAKVMMLVPNLKP